MNFVRLYAIGSVLRSSVIFGWFDSLCSCAWDIYYYTVYYITTQLTFYLLGYHWILLVCCINSKYHKYVCLRWLVSSMKSVWANMSFMILVSLRCVHHSFMLWRCNFISGDEADFGVGLLPRFWLGVFSWASHQGLSALFRVQSCLGCNILYGLSNQPILDWSVITRSFHEFCWNDYIPCAHAYIAFNSDVMVVDQLISSPLPNKK